MPAMTRVTLVPAMTRVTLVRSTGVALVRSLIRTAVPMRVLAVFLRHGSWNRLPYGRGGGGPRSGPPRTAAPRVRPGARH
ncbi:hypothetical protein [Streptomyces uncialis]|uniref:hypothetical protein n=1 Tax=Streptomyces uncialis TaxID=1048205 RepID=UPI003870936F|nr:hypothetical protein OG924_30420 [Streptomyces uncialis]